MTGFDKLVERIEVRYSPDEAVPSEDRIKEALQTVHDRLAIRLKTQEVPALGASIVVDAAMKSLRLSGYEGSVSESSGEGGTISNTFVDNVLKEYEAEIADLKSVLCSKGVRFL